MTITLGIDPSNVGVYRECVSARKTGIETNFVAFWESEVDRILDPNADSTCTQVDNGAT